MSNINDLANISNYTQTTTGFLGGSAGTTITLPSSVGTVTTSPYWSTYSDPNEIVLRKVENGYVLKTQGKEYVITDANQVEKLLKLVGIVIK